MTFAQAIVIQNNFTVTENGMPALNSSMNKNVDLFFKIAASRGKDITNDFAAGFAENADVATRMALWLRDARGGAGERQQFRNILRWFEMHQPAMLVHIVPKVPELGRWDDLLVFQSEDWQAVAFEVIRHALLVEHNGLCAKWMPRKGAIANQLREYLGFSPKQYRKTLVGLSNTVEQLMCSRQWTSIDFNKIPSLAAARYQKAFTKNCAAYAQYKTKLADGTAKINANAIFPYDVLKGSDKIVVQHQWNALPNYLTEGSKILPMIDVSGSMEDRVSNNLSAMDIAISLGLYVATKQTGDFSGVYLTFTDNPKLAVIDRNKNIKDVADSVRHDHVGYSTNIEAAFHKVLDTAVKNQVKAQDMPTHIVVFSDMQFNAHSFGYRDTAKDMAAKLYEQAGYKLPVLVWWNINDRGGNIPVKFDQNGNVLVSGFSPSLVKTILAAKTVTPEQIMLDTLFVERYDL